MTSLSEAVLGKSATSRQWFTGSGKPITFDEILLEIEEGVTIGTDSHSRSGRKRVFATVICLPYGDLSRQYFWSRKIVRNKDIPNLKYQIYVEAQESIDVALEILEGREDLLASDLIVLLDCAPSMSKHKSGRSAKVAENMIQSYGFECVLKPNDPWAANGVADKHSR